MAIIYNGTVFNSTSHKEINIMAKTQDSKKNVKKASTRTAKEKKALKAEKKKNKGK